MPKDGYLLRRRLKDSRLAFTLACALCSVVWQGRRGRVLACAAGTVPAASGASALASLVFRGQTVHSVGDVSDACLGAPCWHLLQRATCSGTCRFGHAWFDKPAPDGSAHRNGTWSECSRAGTCNRMTGQCVCSPGFSGDACQRSEFEVLCSGSWNCCVSLPFPSPPPCPVLSGLPKRMQWTGSVPATGGSWV